MHRFISFVLLFVSTLFPIGAHSAEQQPTAPVMLFATVRIVSYDAGAERLIQQSHIMVANKEESKATYGKEVAYIAKVDIQPDNGSEKVMLTPNVIRDGTDMRLFFGGLFKGDKVAVNLKMDYQKLLEIKKGKDGVEIPVTTGFKFESKGFISLQKENRVWEGQVPDIGKVAVYVKPTLQM